MNADVNPFGVDCLTAEQIQRLQEAAEIYAGGESQLQTTILEGTAKNLQKLLQKTDESEEEVAQAVDEAESQMAELAFGSSDDMFVEIEVEPRISNTLFEEDVTNDEFMGGGNFESLDVLEEEEIGGEQSYEDYQEEWN